MRGVRDHNDAEFFDNELEAKLQAAFAEVEPSDEAAARILGNLKAREAQVQEQAAAQAAAMAAAQAAAALAAQRAAQASAAVPVEETKDPEAMSAEAAQIIAAAREAAPKPKRVIRPWQVIVPAAAVLVLGAVAIASGPLLRNISLDHAGQQAAQPAAVEATSEEAGKAANEAPSSAMGDAASSATGSAGSSAEPSAGIEEQEFGLAPSASAEAASSAGEDVLSEDLSAMDAEKSAAMEEFWARDFTAIEGDNGEAYSLVEGAASAPVTAASEVGDLVCAAVAYNAGETASVTCEIFASKNNPDEFLVSYLGEEVYYKARKA